MFQRAVDWSIQEGKDIAAAYVDDILIITTDQGSQKETVLKHNVDVRSVLDQLQKHKLVADKKVKLFVPKMELCGHF